MANGYTATPSSQTGLVAAQSLGFTIAPIGGNFAAFDSFIVTSSVPGDVFTLGSPATPFFGGVGQIGVTTGGGPGFQLFLTPQTPGPRTLTFTNGTTTPDAAPVQYIATLPSGPAAPDMLRSGSRWMEGVRQASAVTALVYQRGGPGGPSFAIPDATIGMTIDDVVDVDGVTVQVKTRDYLFSAAPFGSGVAFPPISGDQITEINGGVWEVMAIPGKGFWQWHDINETAIRVHVKKISSV